MASLDWTHAKACQKNFLLSQLQHIVNIDTRKIFYSGHIKAYIDYESEVWDDCGEAHFKKKKKKHCNSQHRRAGKLILPDPSLSTEQKMSAHRILNLPHSSRTMKKYLCIKFLIIIPQITWHNSLLITSPTTPTPGITSTCQGQCLQSP